MQRYVLPRMILKCICLNLFFPEAGNVLWKKVVRGQLDTEDARLALAALLALKNIESHAMR